MKRILAVLIAVGVATFSVEAPGTPGIDSVHFSTVPAGYGVAENGSRIHGEPSESAVSDRLDSWKEIAAYLKRDESTVRRWEQEGLPVRRRPHKKQASVYAYKAEIDAWWNDGHPRLAEITRETQEPAQTAAATLTRATRRMKLAVAVLAPLALAGITFGIYKFFGPGKSQSQSGAPFQTMGITRLTHTGKSPSAAISPDGKYVAYSVADGGKQSLWLRQVATNSDVQIVPPAEVHYPTPTFSHDGNYVYYMQAKDSRTLYQIPVLGGTPRKLMVDVGRYVTLSPDDKQLAFVRFSRKDREYALMVANADGTGERKLATRKPPSWFGDPAWSPDGKTIAVGAWPQSIGDVDIVAVPTGGGPERVIGQKWAQIIRLAWFFDGSGLVVSARGQWGLPMQLWQVSYPSGEARRITNDLNTYSDVSLTKDATVLAAVQTEFDSSLWVVPQSGPAQARQLTSKTNKREGIGGLAWTPDGRLVTVGGSLLWIRDADGSNPRPLTPQGSYTRPAISPDGKTVVFESLFRAGSTGIWRMDTDGGNLKQLTRGDADRHPDISPDGKWVVYLSSHSGKSTLSRVPIDGGEPVELAPNLSFSTPSISPDGKLIAFGTGEFPKRRVAIMPFEGGEPIKTLDIPSADNWGPPILRWTPDGQAIAYVERRNGVSNIWSRLLSGGPPKQLTQFTSEDHINWFAWSRDGKQLALSRGKDTNDVVLITNFR